MKTANELWNDVNFLRRRLWSQVSYILRLDYLYFIAKSLTKERYEELEQSAWGVMERFSNRLRELGLSTL